VKLPRRKFLHLAAGAALLAVANHVAWPQTSRAIRFVVPFPAGGGGDLLIRVLAQQMGNITTVVEDRPGAASIVGTEYVSRAAPDGNTLLLVANSFIIHPFFKKLNYEPLTSFVPISLLANSPQVIVVNSTSPYHTLAALLDAARAKPGALTFASIGPATTQHIAFELLKLRAKVNPTFVPFNGEVPAINELLGGHVDTVMANYSAAAENIKAGSLRVLAVGSRARLKWLPDVPTVAESGYPAYEVYVWNGLVGSSRDPGSYCRSAIRVVQRRHSSTRTQVETEFAGPRPDRQTDGGVCSLSAPAEREEYGRAIHEANIQGE
jgi:tripartite-type tricarboxylate transporter receptor subunit TctC